MQNKSKKKQINAWAMYDWANSVYSLVITSTIFPIYYNEVTSPNGTDFIDFLGLKFVNTALYSYAISVSFLIIAFLSPFLSGIADYSGSKKKFMKFFCYLGGLSCMALFFFKGTETLYIGIGAFMLATIGFSGSIVFYNAYLPEIALPPEQDRISAKGYAMGYIGSIILLIVNLLMVMQPQWFGLEPGSMPARISFLMVGVWWIGFAQITFYYLPGNIYHKKPKGNILFKGFRELLTVVRQLIHLRRLKYYLIAFFFTMTGVQTVMYLAATFGEKELGLSSSLLIITILIIQIVAVGGAWLFSSLSGKLGNIPSLIIAVVIWIGICIGAYFVQDEAGFITVAAFVGLVMGGIQSLSRSTYSKLLPKTHDHASFFSFYDVMEKLAIVIGTASFGFIEELTGSMRNSLFALTTFFFIGLFFLVIVHRRFNDRTCLNDSGGRL